MTLQGLAKVAVKGFEERQVVGSIKGWHFFLAMVLIIILAMVPMCGKRKPRRSGGKGNLHSALYDALVAAMTLVTTSSI